MDILVLDSWLREYLDTDVSKADFARLMSRSGPTVDRVKSFGSDTLYEIEVTTNRVDAMSIVGIALEAQAILSFNGYSAKLHKPSLYSKSFPTAGKKVIFDTNKNLVSRLMGVVLTDIKTRQTPDWMKTRLESAGIRSKDVLVDITNYITHEIGHPCHVFDYDSIENGELHVRESKKGEKITTLDGKSYVLSGGDIVFTDGNDTIIDLPGIMGLANSAVTSETKNVLFLLDTVDPAHIRKTSMELNIRTQAAVLNEKGVDAHLAETALLRGVKLFTDITDCTLASPLYDHFEKEAQQKKNKITIKQSQIDQLIGARIEPKKIEKILTLLNFELMQDNDEYVVTVPTSRAGDVVVWQDIVEEIARIYGYQDIDSVALSGNISPQVDKRFSREQKIKEILTQLNGLEVYTLSLVNKKNVDIKKAVKLSNPLGSDTEYLRTSLTPSLIDAISVNKNNERICLFEMANVYHKNNKDLPKEIMTLGAICKGYEFLEVKQILETFLSRLYIDFSSKRVPNESLVYSSKTGKLLTLELLPLGYIYFEGEVSSLTQTMKEYPTYSAPPVYAPQIEDITLIKPESMTVGELYFQLSNFDSHIKNVTFIDSYEDAYTFRMHYIDETKTLTDEEVATIRTSLIDSLRGQGVSVK